jgi:hypothetical protein
MVQSNWNGECVRHRVSTPTVILAFLCANHPAVGQEIPRRLESNVLPPEAIVIGFGLQHDYPSGVQVGLFEKLDARIAIYGHSWGASETVTLVRALGNEGVPVLLTVQVDSIDTAGREFAPPAPRVLRFPGIFNST